MEHTQLFNDFADKAELKQIIYQNTFEAFSRLQDVIKQYLSEYNDYISKHPRKFPLSFELMLNNDFEIELKFGGDILIFLMHTNVFEFSRYHEVMKTSYIKEDNTRSFHGIINIYNFLADSFKYNRNNDVGYLIGRVFINKDNSYFVEGKKELSFLYHNFGSRKFDDSAIDELLEAAIRYSINFDLLTPPYETVKEVTVSEMRSTLDTISFKTGKRLGFRFYADEQNVK
jgi:hypothetical protein